MSTSNSMKDISGALTPTQITKTKTKTQKKAPQEKNLHIYHVNNACLRCGRQGHFSSACYVKKNKYGERIESDSEYNSE